MKKITLLLGFMVAATMVSEKVAAQTTVGPKITYEQDYVDFGDVDYGSNRERVWKFKNTGTEPLTITNAVGSCGCTVPSFPKEPIMPGKTAEIKINYDTNRPGPINKTVTVTTNEATGANTVVIKVKGNIKPAPEKAAEPAPAPAQPKSAAPAK